MHSSALSMPPTGMRRAEKSHRSRYSRSRSQPPTELFANSMATSNLPMKSFFENLLGLASYRTGANSTTSMSRSKLGSSLTAYPPTDRSSRVKIANASSLTYAVSSSLIRTPPTELTVKFRRAGNLVLFSIYWCKLAREKNLLRSTEYRSYLQTRAPTEKFMFDKSNFKIQPLEILPDVKKFFQEPTGSRNFDHVEQIRKSLADIKPFTRLPKKLQDQFLQQAWYECHPAGRTIVRQDLRTSSFFIILSGSAIPTYKRSAEETTETLDVLKRGSTFGEQALITNSAQTFTVTSDAKIELLGLWKDDFKSIFLTNDRHCSKDDLYFLKNNVAFLYGFPIEKLNESADAIQHCHFRTSEVIVRDSRRMKHIYIVQKGSLSIWKRMEPSGSLSSSSKFYESSIEKGKIHDEEDEATGDDRILFSEIKLNDHINKSIFHSEKLDADFRLSRLRRSNIDDQRVLSANSVSTQLTADDNQPVFPGLLDKRDRLQTVDYGSIAASVNKTKLSIANDQIGKNLAVKSKRMSPEKMFYVHVKTLTEGQHFGLSDMIFPNQPVLTLVSNGCECILLHKASFIEIASDQYKQNLRRTEVPYPSDATFYKTFHSNEVWKRLAKNVYIHAFQRVKTPSRPVVRRSTKKTVEQFEYRSIFIDPV